MTYGFKDKESAFSNYNTHDHMLYDDLTGVVVEMVLSDSAALSIVNAAGTNAVEVGSSTYNLNSALVRTANYGDLTGFTLDIAPTASSTIITIHKIVNGKPTPCCTNIGWLGWLNYGSKLSYYHNHAGASSDKAEIDIPTHGNFFFSAGTGSQGVPARAYIGEGGSLISSTSTLVGGSPSASARFQIGNTSISSGPNGEGEIAYVAIFNREMDEAEILQIYAKIQKFFDFQIA